jgi:sentrin-specific protease 7
VRAWGTSNVNGNAQHLASRHPLSSPTLFDDQDRATKKRRRSPGQVIDLDADDDNPASPPRHETKNWRRNQTPSVASVESVEERETKRDATRVFQLPEDNDEVESKSTGKTVRTGLGNGETNGNDAPPTGDVEREAMTQQRFPDSKNWNSDDSESPDELQRDIAAFPKHFGSPRRATKSESSRNDRDESLVKRMNRRQSPNDIRPTVFSSPNRALGKRQTKTRQPAKSHRHLFEVEFFRYDDVEIEGRSIQLFLDEGNDTVGLLAANQTLPSKTIPIQRVVQVLVGTDGNLKCRFKLSKNVQGTVNQESVDIEFGNKADKDQLRTLLEKKGITFQEKQG